MPVPGMANTGRVIAGVGKVYVALPGTAWPVITADALTWGGGWTHLTEETDGGFELSYKETNTAHKIDQQSMSVLYTPDSAEGSLTISMASMDHARLQWLISNALLTPVPAGVGAVGLSKLGVGGSAIKELQIGIEGLAPGNPSGSAWWELIKIWKVIPTSELKKTYKKGSKQMVEAVFQLCADLSQAATETVFVIINKTAEAET